MSADLQDSRVDCKPLRLIVCDAKIADDAYAVYSAMRKTEVDKPELAQSTLWVSLRTFAYTMFFQAFVVQK